MHGNETNFERNSSLEYYNITYMQKTKHASIAFREHEFRLNKC